MKLDIPINDEVKVLNDLLDIDLYAVGGIVRDALFHHIHGMPFEPKDIDLATATKPDDILERLNRPKVHRQGIKALELGKTFGVVAAVFPSKKVYEIATFRQDYYDPEEGDGRHPDEVVFVTPEEDAHRRDLTINALFYDLHDKEVIDYVGTGISDIEQKLIRPVGNPFDRFSEDRLRVLRLARFFCRYVEGDAREELLDDTLAAVEQYKTLGGVSAERIRTELLSGLKQAIRPDHFLRTCHELNLLPAMFPGLEPNVNRLGPTRNPNIALALLFGDVDPKKLARSLDQWTYSRDEVKHIRFLCKFLRFTYDRTFEMVRDRERFDNVELGRSLRASKREDLINEVQEFCRLAKLNRSQAFRLLHFHPTVNSDQFPHMQGPELGQAIREAVAEEFRRIAG